MSGESLFGKIIVVTGGAGALGQQIARAVVARGGYVVVADIALEAAQQVVARIDAETPGCSEAAQLDITNHASITALIDALKLRHGRIDAVVNSAYPRNRNYGRKLEDVSYADFCENVNSHLGGYFLVTQQFCLAFRALGGGNVVNLSSIYGSMAPRFEVYRDTQMTMPVEYAAIKAAVEHLTRYFAKYFKGTGIRVNSLSPGGILDDQPVTFLSAYNLHCASKGMLSAHDIAECAVFLLSDESRYITGQNLVVDDGYSL